MMLVVVIAGIMIALAIPRIDTTRYKADAIAQIVRTTLQNAQRQAITRQHDIVVSFDTSAERIRVFWDANNNGQYQTSERVVWSGLDAGVLFSDPTVHGVAGTTINRAVSGSNIRTLDGWPTITFHRDGSASSDAEIYLSVAAHGPSWYRAVTLTQATGRVDWYRLNAEAGKWKLANQ
jgi:type II secretory pathway pseudopilin PulG